MTESIDKKVTDATKWSTITEVLAKLITPITNLVLARILAPEAFGVLATVTMVTSFADMLTDAGFQKYIIQHKFKNKEKLYNSVNVAFFTNFIISMIVWILIAIFKDQIAAFLGNEKLGLAIMIASIQIPLTALSSIQMALYKRELDFKTLFFRRIISVILPFIVTIPLAFLGLEYWALIIGTLVGQIVNAIILTMNSKWKPKLFYKISILKEMFSFSMWTLIESIVVWLCSYVDVFIIGNIFDNYYLGLYNNSLNLVNAIMNIIKSAIIPVLLSGLSRYQDDDKKYKELLFKFQRMMGCLLIPMGFGIYIYRDFITNLLLGDSWVEAANVIGVMSLIIPFMILLSNYTSICYISKGKPKLSIMAQLLYLVPLIPLGFFSAQKGFWEYVYIRNFFKFELIIINLIILHVFVKISAIQLLKNLVKPFIASIFMSFIGVILKNVANNVLWNLVSIVICVAIYFIILYVIDKEDIINLKEKFLKQGVKKIENN